MPSFKRNHLLANRIKSGQKERCLQTTHQSEWVSRWSRLNSREKGFDDWSISKEPSRPAIVLIQREFGVVSESKRRCLLRLFSRSLLFVTLLLSQQDLSLLRHFQKWKTMCSDKQSELYDNSILHLYSMRRSFFSTDTTSILYPTFVEGTNFKLTTPRVKK